jgi:hypothetical protein
MTCIVHPTEQALKRRIKDLEKENTGLTQENARLTRAWVALQARAEAARLVELEAENASWKEAVDKLMLSSGPAAGARVVELEAKNAAWREAVDNLMLGLESHPPSRMQRWLVEADDIDVLAKLLREEK